jgi:hypothetical protein
LLPRTGGVHPITAVDAGPGMFSGGTRALRDGPAPLTLGSLGAAGTGSCAAHSARRTGCCAQLFPHREYCGVDHRRAPSCDTLRPMQMRRSYLMRTGDTRRTVGSPSCCRCCGAPAIGRSGCGCGPTRALAGALSLLFLNRGERSVADGFVLWSTIGGLSALLAALTVQLRMMRRSMRFWEVAIRESMHRRNSYR